MVRTLLRVIAQVSRRIYVRVILFAGLNILALCLAVVLGPYIPADLGGLVGAESVDTILQVLATSMLAVTTFSLTIMTSAFAQAAGQWTPRAYLLLREDTTTHAVLATFLGSYLFALIGIVMRSAGLFDAGGIVVLFFFTLLVVAAVVVSFIRWIVRLEGLGSLPRTLGALERAARATLDRVARHPCHGGNPITGGHLPRDAAPVTASCSGYVQQVFEEALQTWAAANTVEVWVAVEVGQYVYAGDELAYVTGKRTLGEVDVRTLREAIRVAEVRNFSQDPAFCVEVLAEVATRALSPGVNDPGTAVEVVNRLGGIVHATQRIVPADAPLFDRLWFHRRDSGALFRRSFDPISRHADAEIDVHIALRDTLARLAEGPEGPIADAARACAARCADRAHAALEARPDRDLFDRS